MRTVKCRMLLWVDARCNLIDIRSQKNLYFLSNSKNFGTFFKGFNWKRVGKEVGRNSLSQRFACFFLMFCLSELLSMRIAFYSCSLHLLFWIILQPFDGCVDVRSYFLEHSQTDARQIMLSEFFLHSLQKFHRCSGVVWFVQHADMQKT